MSWVFLSKRWTCQQPSPNEIIGIRAVEVEPGVSGLTLDNFLEFAGIPSHRLKNHTKNDQSRPMLLVHSDKLGRVIHHRETVFQLPGLCELAFLLVLVQTTSRADRIERPCDILVAGSGRQCPSGRRGPP
jgi:hypothetical protein